MERFTREVLITPTQREDRSVSDLLHTLLVGQGAEKKKLSCRAGSGSQVTRSAGLYDQQLV